MKNSIYICLVPIRSCERKYGKEDAGELLCPCVTLDVKLSYVAQRRAGEEETVEEAGSELQHFIASTCCFVYQSLA